MAVTKTKENTTPRKRKLSDPGSANANQNKTVLTPKTTPQTQKKMTPATASGGKNKKQKGKGKSPGGQDDEVTLKLPKSNSKIFAGKLNEDSDEEIAPVVETPKKRMKLSSPSPVKSVGKNKTNAPGSTLDDSRKKTYDDRTLFLKNLPPKVTTEQIQSLSSDITHIRLRMGSTREQGKRSIKNFAYIEFKSEEIAEKNFKKLSGSTLGGNELVVDYVGTKSAHSSGKTKEPQDDDPLKLYITGYPVDATAASLNGLFPKAAGIDLPTRKKGGKALGFGFVRFANAKDAKQAHDTVQGKQLKGQALVVLYAKVKKATEEPKKKPVQKKGAKASKKADEDEEDDDDADDDDEEMDDDDDDQDGEDGDDDDDDDADADE